MDWTAAKQEARSPVPLPGRGEAERSDELYLEHVRVIALWPTPKAGSPGTGADEG